MASFYSDLEIGSVRLCNDLAQCGSRLCKTMLLSVDPMILPEEIRELKVRSDPSEAGLPLQLICWTENGGQVIT